MNQHINNEMISKYMSLQTHSHNTIYFEIIMDGINFSTLPPNLYDIYL